MGKNCEQIRQLLVELEYGELGTLDSDAVQAHLDECQECAARQLAYRSVRADLQAWNDVEPAPSRVTFVAMNYATRTSQWSRWTKGLAVAASFLVGFLVTAAVANMQISSTDGGWSLSTSLWPNDSAPSGSPTTPARSAAGPVTPVSTDRGASTTSPAGQIGTLQVQANLDDWLEQRLRTRGRQTAPGSLSREQVEMVLQQLIADRDAQIRALIQEVVAASEQRQRRDFDSALTGVYQTFDAQRANDLLFLAGEMGLMQENTGLELQRTNAAIDYLITRAAADPRQQEERDDDD